MIKMKYLNCFWLIFGLMFVQSGFALQVKSVTENGAATAIVSATELTRIAVNHDRILHIRGLQGAYDLKYDSVQGALFIKPTADYQTKSFSIFIATEQNHNYVLHLIPQAHPADTILLKPRGIQHPLLAHEESSIPYPKQLADLITQMMNKTTPSDYSVDTFAKAKHHRICKEMTAQLVRVYTGDQLQGVVFRITNHSTQTLTLNENAFYQRGDRAIALSNLTIAPGSTVLLYKVRSHA